MNEIKFNAIRLKQNEVECRLCEAAHKLVALREVWKETE